MDSEPAQDDSDDDDDDNDDDNDPTVQQIHQRVEDVIRGDGDLGLGDGLALAAAPHLLQQPRHLLDGVVNLGHEAATQHTLVSNFTKMQFAAVRDIFIRETALIIARFMSLLNVLITSPSKYFQCCKLTIMAME